MTMSPKDALQAWQDGKLSEADAMTISGARDGWELWGWVIDWGIDIRLGDPERVRAVIEGKRQIARGEWVDLDDVIEELERIIDGSDL